MLMMKPMLMHVLVMMVCASMSTGDMARTGGVLRAHVLHDHTQQSWTGRLSVCYWMHHLRRYDLHREPEGKCLLARHGVGCAEVACGFVNAKHDCVTLVCAYKAL